jgi:hypothetical protein
VLQNKIQYDIMKSHQQGSGAHRRAATTTRETDEMAHVIQDQCGCESVTHNGSTREVVCKRHRCVNYDGCRSRKSGIGGGIASEMCSGCNIANSDRIG